MNSSLYFIIPVSVIALLLFRNRAKKEALLTTAYDLTPGSTTSSEADQTLLESEQSPEGFEEIEYNYDVVWESYQRDHLTALIRAHKAFDTGQIFSIAVLEMEPSNPFDSSVVKVVVEGTQVGYIPKFDSPVVTEMIKKSGKKVYEVPVRIGWDTNSPSPLIGVRLALIIE